MRVSPSAAAIGYVSVNMPVTPYKMPTNTKRKNPLQLRAKIAAAICAPAATSKIEPNSATDAIVALKQKLSARIPTMI
jgi:hypothetical protein